MMIYTLSIFSEKKYLYINFTYNKYDMNMNEDQSKFVIAILLTVV